jgi:hypothetical protein
MTGGDLLRSGRVTTVRSEITDLYPERKVAPVQAITECCRNSRIRRGGGLQMCGDFLSEGHDLGVQAGIVGPGTSDAP